MSLKNTYDKLFSVYEQGVSKSDSKLLQSFLDDQTYIDLKSDRKCFLEILQLRSGVYSLFGDFKNAGYQYHQGYDLCVDSSKWIYLYNWSLVYLRELNLNRGEDKLRESFLCGIDILERSLHVLPEDNNIVYYKLAINNLKAFMHLLLSDKKKAKDAMHSNTFVPIPIPDYNDKESLQFLFSHFTKGLAVAIELMDEELLLNMLKVIAIDDELLYSDTNLFDKFYSILVTTFDMRPEFILEFNSMFKLKDKFEKEAPRFAEFLDLVGNQKNDELKSFFNNFKD